MGKGNFTGATGNQWAAAETEEKTKNKNKKQSTPGQVLNRFLIPGSQFKTYVNKSKTKRAQEFSICIYSVCISDNYTRLEREMQLKVRQER